MKSLRLLDLFSGIGGFSLGLERSGAFKTVAFCEIDPFCRRVLAKHWPKVPCYDDVRSLTADALSRDGIGVDAICGGFPCQDISTAGSGAGLDGARSGLWFEYARIIGEIRPRVVIVENVSALLGRGLSRVLGDLAALGYDAEWHCISAAYVGAHHRRDRIWIVADAGDDGRPQSRRLCVDSIEGEAREERDEQATALGNSREAMADAYGIPSFGAAISRQKLDPWLAEPKMDRVVNGIPRKLVESRVSALGNAVVPQISELIGRAIADSLRAA